MINRTLHEIATMSGGTLATTEFIDTPIQGVTTDSRQITKGCLFVPLVGERFDGHDYAEAALHSGAAAILWQADHGQPPTAGPVIIVEDTLTALQQLASSYLQVSGARVVGITGSNGKTTTKDIVSSLLSQAYKVHKTQGNFNNHIGLPLTILSMEADTQIAVLEMGMSARGEIQILSQIAHPEATIVTNIGESHLEHLGSRQEIARAKLEILDGLTPGGLFVYNGDEPLIPLVLEEEGTVRPEGLQQITFGLEASNDFFPTGIMAGREGTIFTTNRYGAEDVFSVPLLGRHNVSNALGAIAIADYFGLTSEQIRKGLQELKLTSMRIEIVKAENGVTVLNDAYNASPTSMKAAIEVLESMQGYRSRIAVLGDMLELGEEAEHLHKEVGLFLTAGKVDQLYTYGELGAFIAEGAATQLASESIHVFTDKSLLMEALGQYIRPDDIVLVKASRGKRLEEVVHYIINQPHQS